MNFCVFFFFFFLFSFVFLFSLSPLKLTFSTLFLFSDEKVSLTGLPLNERVSGGITVTTSSGQKLEADIVIPCFGSTVNTYGFATALRK